MPRPLWIMTLALATLAGLAAGVAGKQRSCPPPTPKKPVVDTYHGTPVTDEYRWLEEWSSKEVRAWSEAQNACARTYLDALPGRQILRDRFKALLEGGSPSYWDLRTAGGTLFAMKSQPPRQQPFLIALGSLDDAASARIVVDPNTLDARGTTAIDWYVPSPDGKLLAVSISQGGSEDGTLRIFDAATGKPVFEVISRVQEGTAGGSLVWDRSGTGFYYTRYPRGTERPRADLDFYQQIYHHTLGSPEAKDTYCLGKDFPRIAETTLERSEDGAFILATVQNGDGGEFAFHLLGPSGGWVRVADFKDKVKQAVFGPAGTLYLCSTQDAPLGQVLRLNLAEPDLAKAVVLVPQSRVAVKEVLATTSRVYVRDSVGGPSQVRVFDPAGKLLGNLPIMQLTSVNEMRRLGQDDLLYASESFLSPPGWYRYTAATAKITETALMETSPASFADIQIVSTYGLSRDGTKVPLIILKPADARLDGSNPTLLTGYGGFGISQVPTFSAARRVFIEHGGVIAIASLRGGGEWGEDWHHAGNLTRKQNVFDDFYGCAKALVDKRYTTPERLAITGGSNGGLLMGAALTQHPEMFKAVVSHVGIYDMLRVELSSNGSFNVTEYGTVKEPDQFRALLAYSPYHHVTSQTRYPASLFLTGANDPRVDPMQSRKFVAALQAANTADSPVLLRTNARAGHGLDLALSERIEEHVDVHAFLFHALGVTASPAKPAQGRRARAR